MAYTGTAVVGRVDHRDLSVGVGVHSIGDWGTKMPWPQVVLMVWPAQGSGDNLYRESAVYITPSGLLLLFTRAVQGKS